MGKRHGSRPGTGHGRWSNALRPQFRSPAAGKGSQFAAFLAGNWLRTRKLKINNLDLPQARHTYTVLGAQPEGCWGYTQGG